MGEVYQATDLMSGWQVAVKRMLLDEDDPVEIFDPFQKFRAEFDTLKALDHPGIPRVLDFFLEEQCPCMVMEFIEGQNLDDWVYKVRGQGRNWILQESDPLVDRQVLHFGLQLCVILEYIHARGILHRDIKPSNIILRDRTERLVLVDFGLARAYTGSRSTKTQVGTLGYCSVEQAQGHPEPRSDLYSLAVTLNHLLTGNQPAPFEVKLLQETRPDLPPRLIAALDRACSFAAADRQASLGEFRGELEACLNEMGSGLPDQTVRPDYFLEASGTYTEEVEAPPAPAVSERISTYNWLDQALLAQGPAARPDARSQAVVEPAEEEEDESSGVQRWVAAAKTRQVPGRRETVPVPQQHAFRVVEEEDDLEFIRNLKSARPPIYTHPVVIFLVLVAATAGLMRYLEGRSEQSNISLAARLAVGGPSVAREGARAGAGGTLDLVAGEDTPALVVYSPLKPMTELSFTMSIEQGDPDLVVYLGESPPETSNSLRRSTGAALWLRFDPAELDYQACLAPATRMLLPADVRHPGMFLQLFPPSGREFHKLPSGRTFFVRLILLEKGRLEARLGSLALSVPVATEVPTFGVYILGQGRVNLRDLKVVR